MIRRLLAAALLLLPTGCLALYDNPPCDYDSDCPDGELCGVRDYYDGNGYPNGLPSYKVCREAECVLRPIFNGASSPLTSYQCVGGKQCVPFDGQFGKCEPAPSPR